MTVLAMMVMITRTSDDFDEDDKNGSGSIFLQPFKEQSKFSKGFFRTKQSHLIAWANNVKIIVAPLNSGQWQ